MEQHTDALIMHVAIITALILAFLFLLFSNKPSTPANSAIKDYININRWINECTSFEQLASMMPKCEAFYDNHYYTTDHDILNKYYSDLLQSISAKKNQFNAIEEITA